MATSKKNQPLKLEPETWGERYARAYRTSRHLYGRTYEEVAELLTSVGKDCAPSALYKLANHDEVPGRMPSRQRAYLALLAYGFAPEDFGLTIENSGLKSWDMKRVVDQLKPKSPCITVRAGHAA